MNKRQKQGLANCVGDTINWDCSLSAATSFGIGGRAAALVVVVHAEELQQLLRYCESEKMHWRVIGGGTNLLVSDQGYDGVVIRLAGVFKSVAVKQDHEEGWMRVEVGAGYGLSRLADWCGDHGMSGLEFAAGIPGTLGGAVIMNAGAWGSEIGDVLHQVELVGCSGMKRLKREQLHFGYRCWQEFGTIRTRQVVTGATFRLRQEEGETIKARVREYRKKRKETQPHGQGSCGSFFKNPGSESAGRLIEQCGLKGTKIGGAMVSEKHANFFLNTGEATATDMIRLMEMVQKRVEEQLGIRLEPEVHFLS